MNLNPGLSVGDVTTVSVSISASAAPQRNFGSLLILGDSAVINVQDRFRVYTSPSAVAADFPPNAPEVLAAQIYFAQNPQPSQVYVGAWAQAATPGTLMGDVLSAAEQVLANFTAITSGAMNVTVDGALHQLSGINLSLATNLNGVASAVTTAFAGTATMVWDAVNQQFVIKSATTGVQSQVSVASSPATGVDVSGLLGLTLAMGAYAVPGIAAETGASCVAALAALTSAWYGVMFAAANPPSDADIVNIAGVIAGQTITRIFGVTTQEIGATNATVTTDVAALLAAGAFRRTFCAYSSTNPYAVAALFGNAFTVDFSGTDTTITLKFKQALSVAPDILSETQAAALKGTNCNVFVEYNDGVAIIQEGVMCDGSFFDVIHGADWLQNAVQTAVFNTFLAARKIKQTDGGVDILLGNICNTMDGSVDNGYVAPGVWTGPAIGSLARGQTLTKGYYVYAPAVATQSVAARGARQTPVMSVAAKLAGAFHSANVMINVNP